jgi:serine/threonine protein kinase
MEIGESIGNHKILSQLGQGGMGVVYAAQDVRLGRRVAIKVLHPAVMLSANERQRFQAEARVQAGLNHPNLVTLHEFEPYQDSYYMVMEYVEGKNLAEIVRSGGAFPPSVVVCLAKQVLDGLSTAHRHGVIHRDLKPSNIMVTNDGIAKVMDFGIAKVRGEKSLTASGELVGTVYYMSPEQVRGEKLDQRSDLYSLGIILFELLTGRVPFQEESDFAIMRHHVDTPAPPPTQFLPDIPGDLEDIVLRCLSKRAADRFPDADAILAALDSYEEQERAMGRGQIYSRRYLAQWLANPSFPPPAAKPSVPTPDSTVTTPPKDVATTAAPVPVVPPPVTPPVSPPVVPVAPPETRTTRGPGGAVAVLGIATVLGAGLLYYMMRPRAASTEKVEAIVGGSGGHQTPVPPGPPAKPADGGTIASGGGLAPPPSGGEAPQPPGSAPPGSAPGGRPTPLVAGGESAPATPGLPGPGKAPAGPPNVPPPNPSGGGKAPVPGPGAPPPPVRPGPAPQVEARRVLIFLDTDSGSEKLPLGAAQAQLGDIVRQEGHEVASAGVVSAGVRTALDRGNLAEVRRQGIGYVVLGTAGGSLETQAAYGQTLYVAKVHVRLELIRMSDGSVAATGSEDARSRGSANAGDALSTALMTALSTAGRDLMRNFKP